MKNNKITKIMLTIILLVIVIVGFTTYMLNHYYNSMNITNNIKEKNDTITMPNTSEVSELYHQNDLNDEINADDENEIKAISELDEVIHQMELKKKDIQFEDNIFNILLIGSDSRNEEKDRGRSDSMILVSINKNTKKIFVTSFMRDMYVNIPERKNNRINSAYAYGGANLLMDTIESNFQIKVDRYIQIGFDTFMEAIDFCGGISGIPLSDEELKYVNSYMYEINKIHKLDPEDGYHDGTPDADGTYSLNGKQALSYSRIRYVSNGEENNDFGRTARQRTVILALYNKLKTLNILELNKLLNNILPQVSTNITKEEFFSLLLDYSKYINYEVVQQRIPIDGSYESLRINNMSVIGVDFEKNIQYLHQNIYETNEIH